MARPTAFQRPLRQRPESYYEPARALAASASGEQASAVFLYRFGYVATAERKPGHGAGHASELSFVFGNTGADAQDRAAADLMGAYWTNFAKQGDPNGPGLPAWPAYTPSSDQLLAITTDGGAAAKAGGPELDAITAHYSHR